MIDDNPIRMTRRALNAMPEYSTSLPTGTTPGKRWRRDLWRDGTEWWQGRYGKPIPNPNEALRKRKGLETVTPIAWRRIIVQGDQPRWPRHEAVLPRQVDGPRYAQLGTEEGDLCLRSYDGSAPCLGKLELRRDSDIGGCYCFICAPCGSCMSMVPECPVCCHREQEPD